MKIKLELGYPTPETEKWFQDMFDKHGFLLRIGDDIRVTQGDYNNWSQEQREDYDHSLDCVSSVYFSLWHNTIFIEIKEK